VIANLGPIGVAILVVGALLTLACLFRKPAPGAEPPQDEPQARNVPEPRPMTAPGAAPGSPEPQPRDIEAYANGAYSIGPSASPAGPDRKDAVK
jgi:hypothetical protein